MTPKHTGEPIQARDSALEFNNPDIDGLIDVGLSDGPDTRDIEDPLNGDLPERDLFAVAALNDFVVAALKFDSVSSNKMGSAKGFELALKEFQVHATLLRKHLDMRDGLPSAVARINDPV